MLPSTLIKGEKDEKEKKNYMGIKNKYFELDLISIFCFFFQNQDN